MSMLEVLEQADQANRVLKQKRREAAELDRLAHVPKEWDAQVALYWQILKRHNEAVLADQAEVADQALNDLEDLVTVANGGKIFGYRAPDGALTRLAAATHTPHDVDPMWGQAGKLVLEIPVDGSLIDRTCTIIVDWEGFGGLRRVGTFAARAAFWSEPFISQTGYRSFCFYSVWAPGKTPRLWAEQVIRAHIETELNGKLIPLDPKWRTDVPKSEV